MNQPTNPDRAPSPLLLVGGLLLGGALLVFMAWDAIAQFFGKDPANSAPVVKLTDDNWQKEVVESSIPVMVDFWGPGCPPCEMLAPIIAKLAEKYQGKFKVGKLNVEQSEKTAIRYGISGLPTVMIFNGSADPLMGFDGFHPEKTETKLVNAIETVLAKK
jgi:thioredoxin 1